MSPNPQYITNKITELELLLNSHAIGECLQDCNLCKEELILAIQLGIFEDDIESIDIMYYEHLEKHRYAIYHPHGLIDFCKYCREEFEVLVLNYKDKN